MLSPSLSLLLVIALSVPAFWRGGTVQESSEAPGRQRSSPPPPPAIGTCTRGEVENQRCVWSVTWNRKK